MFLLVWKKCLNYFKKKLSINEFSMWINPLKLKIKNSKIILYTSNKFTLHWIKEKYFKKIKKLLNYYHGNKSLKIKLEIQKKKKKKNIYLYKKIYKKKKCSNIYKKIYNFKNFITGKSNKLAYKSAYLIAKHPGKFYNPLFLYGKTGLGKTHLLYAIKNFIIKNKKNTKIIYISSENFVRNMVKSLKNNSIDKFKKYYRSTNILLMDDIQFFSNKKRSQEEFFHTFNDLIKKKKQIVLTSNCYPISIKGIKNRLKSRLDCGLSICIKPPKIQTRISILVKKSLKKNIFLKDKIIYFIAKKLNSNIRELEGAINKIKAYAFLKKKKNITLNFVKNALKDLFFAKKKKITINKIQKVVSNYYNIKLSELLSKKKSLSIILPRQIAIKISRKLTTKSLKEIGAYFNKKSHTTVIYSCKKIKTLCNNNSKIKKDYYNLLKKIS
ncbi:MAG: chromosomal replication initiator protein DnaA [Buchnera aphidicola (Periphyllus acericola)]|uniref:chromosomal replication initiator protein DnaA n=1 Tax=Buchnera aphidicola TaxID=9 RepID=UPI0030CB2B49|nr:chromosomal replication initiator protein DnaA [Buchnera aphidicola (Periphyllus acericola)]